jgi:hypothetical protein
MEHSTSDGAREAANGRRELKHLTDWNDGGLGLSSISDSIGNATGYGSSLGAPPH